MSEAPITPEPTFSEAFDTARQAFIQGRAVGQQERGELFRLLAAGVARRYEREGNTEMHRAADEVCRILFALDLKLWPDAMRDQAQVSLQTAEATP